jgi:aerobic-type carbon monoxide dehydrogenase small subunit (CoxS/CutS family)
VSEHDIQVEVNGTSYREKVPGRLMLADFLRHQLKLTGTHLGCEHGVCGACTVLIDGRSARSCLMLAAQADGAKIQTIEGVAGADGTLHPFQQAMIDHHGLQCGFCTPGIVMTVLEMLKTVKSPDEDTVREWLSGNLCRGTGYHNIVDAVLAVFNGSAKASS